MKTTSRSRRIAGIAATLEFILSVAGLAPDSLADATGCFSGEMVLVLEDALDRNALSVFLNAENGQWFSAFAHAPGYSRSLYDVSISTNAVESSRLNIGLDVTLKPDRYGQRGGSASFNLSVEQKGLNAGRPSSSIAAITGCDGVFTSPHPHLRTTVADALLEGEYQGQCNGKQVKGRVVGIRLSSAHSSRRLLPLPPEEHPRLLFRKQDAEALRQRLATPTGKVILDRLEACDHEVAFGLLYQLKDDKTFASKAYDRVERIMRDAYPSEKSGYGGIVSEHQNTQLAGKLGTVAITYDLCSGGWDGSAVKSVEEWLDNWTHHALRKENVWGNQPMTTPGYHHDAFMIYGAGGLGALTFLGRRGAAPVEPVAIPGAFNKYIKAGVQTADDRLARWRRDHALWQETGQCDLSIYRNHETSQRLGRLCLAQGYIGEGGTLPDYGFQWELAFFDFLIAHRNTLGIPLSGRPYTEWLAAPHIVGTVWSADRPLSVLQSPPRGSQLVRWLALCPDNWRPVVLGYWCRIAGIKGDELHTADGFSRLCATIPPIDPMGLCLALEHVLPDLKPSGSAPPVPLFWESTTSGIYLLRSGWDDTQAVLARLDVRPASSMQTRIAGTFQILGFGSLWVGDGPQSDPHGGRHGQTESRERCSVVQVPVERILTGPEPGALTDARFGPSQTWAVVSMSLDECYMTREIYSSTTFSTSVRGVIRSERPTVSVMAKAVDTGIRATRSFGVDYSGTSGAPAMFAVLDRMTGSDDPKEWYLSVPCLTNKTAGTIAGNTFTITQGGATLRGTVVLPPNPRVAVVNRQVPSLYFRDKWEKLGPKSGGFLEDTSRWPHSPTGSVETVQSGIVVTGQDARQGDFLVVLTMQKDVPPAVTCEGQGAAARITVGNRKIAIDGGRIVFAQ